MAEHNLADLMNDNILDGVLVGHDKALARLALACDGEIPQHARGYVSQLISNSASRSVQLDAARQLSKYVTFTQPIPNE